MPCHTPTKKGNNDLKGAIDDLSKAIDNIKNSVSANESLCVQIVTDLEDMKKDMYNSFIKAKQKLASLSGSHYQQRSTGPTSPYSTKTQTSMSSHFSLSHKLVH